jgi:hypothetical protein
MMKIRCLHRFFPLLFCLPLGLSVATTARGASDSDDEEWHDTKGPHGEPLDSAGSKSEKKSEPSSSEEADKPAEKSSDKGADTKEAEANATKKSSESSANTKDSDRDGDGKKSPERQHKSPPSTTKISVGVLGSYGIRDPLNFGLGLRVGAHIASIVPLYVGGIGQYFFGLKSIHRDLGDRIEASTRFMYFGAEGGVDIAATNDLMLRPMFGLGLGLQADKRSSSTSGNTVHGTLLATLTPGITGLYQIGTFFLGLDLRYLIVPSRSTTSGVIISGTAGLQF